MQSRVSLGQVYDFINPERPFTPNDYFVATWQEFERIRTDPKFAQVTVRSTIPYPNGETGFYVFNVRLAGNIRQLLAEEDLARRTPVEETIEWMGQTVRVRHFSAQRRTPARRAGRRPGDSGARRTRQPHPDTNSSSVSRSPLRNSS